MSSEERESPNGVDTQLGPTLVHQSAGSSRAGSSCCNPTLAPAEAPSKSPRTSHSPTMHSEGLMNEGMVCRAQEALSVLEQPSQECGVSQDAPALRVNASTYRVEPISGIPNSSTQQDDPRKVHLQALERCKASHKISSEQMSIAYVLGGTVSSTEHAQAPQSTVPNVASSTPPTIGAHPTDSLSATSASLQPPAESSMPSTILKPSTTPSMSNDDPNLGGEALVQKLQAIGRILIPQSKPPDRWLALPLHILLSQDVLEFYAWYAQTSGAGDVFALRFELLDVAPQPDRLTVISPGDSDAFCALKERILKWFTLLRRDPESATFEVLVTSRPQQVAAERLATSTLLANRTGNSQPLKNLRSLVQLHTFVASASPKPSHLPVPDTVTRTSYFQRPSQGERRLIPRGSNTGPAAQHPPPTTAAPTAPNRGRNPPHRTSSDQPLASRAAQDHHTPVIPARPARGPGGRVHEPSTTLQIAVRIQENGRGEYSRRFNMNVLPPEISNVEFFDWFARRTSYALPGKLKFTFKDALPIAKSYTIAWGNEEHFSAMKHDIRPQCNHAAALTPDLFEFVIMVSWFRC